MWDTSPWSLVRSIPETPKQYRFWSLPRTAHQNLVVKPITEAAITHTGHRTWRIQVGSDQDASHAGYLI